MQRQRRARRLPNPRSVPQYNGSGFVPPIRAPPFFPDFPPSNATPGMPCIPASCGNMNTPSAMGWQQHLATHFMQVPTPANTPAWPEQPAVPLEEGVVASSRRHATLDAWYISPSAVRYSPSRCTSTPSLIPNPINPTIPQLQWDVIHAPEQARLYTGRGIVKKPNLKDTAVFPNAEKIWICADEMNCPILGYWMQIWGTHLESTSPRAYFMAPLNRRDFRLIRGSRSPINPSPLTPLRNEGYALPDYSVQEFKRVDVLGAFRQWGGVRPVVFHDGSWRLFLNLLPYAVPRVTGLAP
ncbi:hypothetical protein C8F04DRAFT_1104652, partial [Mycena alexandri]